MKMTRRSALVLAGTGATIVAGMPQRAMAATDTVPPAVYLVPHQDDEFLSMGADMKIHLLAGRPVEVFLYTSGEETYLRERMGLSRAETTARRDAEFYQGLMYMGVPSENIHIMVDPDTGVRPDDHVDLYACKRILNEVISVIESKYPNTHQQASYKAMSWEDNHVGHSSMGRALRVFYIYERVFDTRWFLKRRSDGTWPDRPDKATKTSTSLITRQSHPEEWYEMLAQSYSYGIGNISVTAEFELMRNDMRSIVHDYVR